MSSCRFAAIINGLGPPQACSSATGGDASAGVAGIWRQADARLRGMKRVQVEPHLSVTGAVAAEWIPIRPKTDAAFLYAVIHRLLLERDWREECDVPFIGLRTGSPYLVGPNGWFLREAATGDLKGVLAINDEPLVSIDFNHNPHSSIYEASLTKVSEGTLVKVCSWYDNEWGFSNRMLDTTVALVNAD